MNLSKNKKIKTYKSVEEWKEEGKKLFGKEFNKWEFVCPKCGHIQSVSEFLERTDLSKKEIAKYICFSCIGRFLKDQEPKFKKSKKFHIEMKGGGCNWSLGGLFNFHEAEVQVGDNVQYIFKFNKEENI